MGYTVYVKISGNSLGQPFENPVTSICAVMGEVEKFWGVNEGIAEIPLSANPMEGIVLVQVIIEPGILEVNAIPP